MMERQGIPGMGEAAKAGLESLMRFRFGRLGVSERKPYPMRTGPRNNGVETIGRAFVGDEIFGGDRDDFKRSLACFPKIRKFGDPDGPNGAGRMRSAKGLVNERAFEMDAERKCSWSGFRSDPPADSGEGFLQFAWSGRNRCWTESRNSVIPERL